MTKDKKVGMANSLSDGQAAIGMLLEEKYRLQRELGAGGMGQVFLAHHETIERDVAIKVLHRNLAADPEVRQRFETEARAIARLRHPNCVMLYEFGYSRQIAALFAVFEYVEGDSLEKWVGQQLPLSMVVEIGYQIAEGVDHAHGQKIIHRDLKPDNVMIVAQEDGSMEVKILDFGIARITGDERDTRLTRAGQMFGTPPYMSPEQIKAKLDVTFATDIYSIGVILYELIEGRLPFMAETPIEIVMMHLNEEVPPMEREGLPEELRQIVMRCLEKEPAKRFKSARELARALDRVAALFEESEAEEISPVASTIAQESIEPNPGQTDLVFAGSAPVAEEVVEQVVARQEPVATPQVVLESGRFQSAYQDNGELETAELGKNEKGKLLPLVLVLGLLLLGAGGGGAAIFFLLLTDADEEEALAEVEPALEELALEELAEADEAEELDSASEPGESDDPEQAALGEDKAQEPAESGEEEAQTGVVQAGGDSGGSVPSPANTEGERASTRQGHSVGAPASASGGRGAQERAPEKEERPASLSINRQRSRPSSAAKVEEERPPAPPTGLSLQRRNRPNGDEKDEAREQPSRLSIPQRN